MSNSVKKGIDDAILEALAGISGIGRTQMRPEHWEEIGTQDFPVAYLVEHDPTYERFCYGGVMLGTVSVEIWGMVWDVSGQVEQKRSNLERDIIVAISGDTDLAALVLDVVETGVQDLGRTDTHSVFSVTFDLKFEYVAGTP